jgi:hypothetical protein
VGVGLTLLVRMIRARAPNWRLLPILIPLSLTMAFMGLYFIRTTGSPFLSPYQVNQRTYSAEPVPFFVWQRLAPAPEYRHPIMKEFYVNREAPGLFEGVSIPKFLRNNVAARLGKTLWFFLGPALAVGLVAAARTVRDRRMRPLLWIALIFGAGQAAQVHYWIHYTAPITGLILALILQSFRHLRAWRFRGSPVGRFVTRAIPVICFVMVLVRIAHPPGEHEFNRSRPAIWCCTEVGNLARERALGYLKSSGGQHLVLVHYAPTHNVHDEWVYNEANIDEAEVVFAREMDAASNRELIQYFKNRTVWTLLADATPPELYIYKKREEQP